MSVQQHYEQNKDAIKLSARQHYEQNIDAIKLSDSIMNRIKML